MKRVLLWGLPSTIMLGVGVWLLFQRPDSEGATVTATGGTAQDADANREDTSQYIALTEHGAEMVSATIASSAESAAESVLNDKQRLALAASVESAIKAYAGDTYDPFVDFMVSHGIDPPDVLLSDPSGGDFMWGLWREFFASGSFDPSQLSVRNGAATVPPPALQHGSRSASRVGSRPSVEGIPVEARTTVEVVVPSRFRDTQGVAFAANLGLEFVKDREGKWVLTRVSLYDVPMGIAVPSIPV